VPEAGWFYRMTTVPTARGETMRAASTLPRDQILEPYHVSRQQQQSSSRPKKQAGQRAQSQIAEEGTHRGLWLWFHILETAAQIEASSQHSQDTGLYMLRTLLRTHGPGARSQQMPAAAGEGGRAPW
jgi:hypothetical protein